MTDSQATECKVVLLGSDGVGKSSLVVRFVNNACLKAYDPTIEDTFSKQITVDQKPAVLHILDTAGDQRTTSIGKKEFKSMREQWIAEGQGFLLIYSITDPKSLEEVKVLYSEVIRLKDEDHLFPIVLVGNKCDLQSERKISTKTGRQLASEWGCPYFETSAEQGINHKKVFYEIVRRIRTSNVHIGCDFSLRRVCLIQ